MIVEEKKAADRICPQMIHNTPEYRWCQGSRCMAWQWVRPGSGYEDGDMGIRSNTHGYCGLAGRP